MADLTHLNALETRLSNERNYLAREENTLNRKGIAIRKIWISQIQKEIAAEYKFLGIAPLTIDEITMSDDELLAELAS